MSCLHARKVPQQLTIEGDEHLVCADCGEQVGYGIGQSASDRENGTPNSRPVEGQQDFTFHDYRSQLPA